MTLIITSHHGHSLVLLKVSIQIPLALPKGDLKDKVKIKNFQHVTNVSMRMGTTSRLQMGEHQVPIFFKFHIVMQHRYNQSKLQWLTEFSMCYYAVRCVWSS